MTELFDPVSLTARLTAAERARESQRTDRLFADPWAERLAGPDGEELLMEFQGSLSVENPTVPVRTRFFDEAVLDASAGGLRQIALVAAGMDSRPLRLALPEETVVYELDRPDLLELKGRLLGEVPGGGPVRLPVGTDLAQEWTKALLDAGFRTDLPVCWVAEGLSQYLEEKAVLGLLDRITSLSAPGSRVLMDFVGRSLLESPAMAPMLELFGSRGMTWKYGDEAPEELFARRGWRAEVTRLGTAGTRFGRWPFPDVPRGTPGVPQGYLVSATR
ncbi:MULTISPECIES: SAM-dependent methyltransferase [Streptomyces]|uniref:SAM-dependent methyltransferase n=1 Tax=Streptomyces TaxID=1883 RepID=UPI00163B675E|nr:MULTISPECIES: SAM-dependent methyltransferase [Streptomyces]MBC2876714.1 SAM-dependent methyltransferase [Streptomyces sp. TYQ1024]UBI36342.1 SAM-dependent methyltransferase [Streptomyces mobaraensis]UKW28936.1 SAM-dependent methyltransferase [Streptomyces sp. TYQ1024]